MPAASSVASHAGQVEYLKERARLQAASLLDDVSVAELLDDPQGYVDDIVAAAMHVLDPILDDAEQEAVDYAKELGMEEIDQAELDDARGDVENSFATYAAPALLAALAPALRSIQDQQASGIAPDVIAAMLSAVATRDALLAPFLSQLRSLVAFAVQDSVRSLFERARDLLVAGLGVVSSVKFVWITVEDLHVCDSEEENSCAPRHGQLYNVLDLIQLGAPGAPNLLCTIWGNARGVGSLCRCMLALDDGSIVPADAVDASAEIADGKGRAQDEFG